MIDAETLEALKFIAEKFGGFAVVLIYLMIMSWKLGRRFSKFETGFSEVTKDVASIKLERTESHAENSEEHKEMRDNIQGIDRRLVRVETTLKI